MPSLSRLEHDRRAVRIVGAHEVHCVSLHPLEAHPDVRLDVLHDVADMERAVGVGKRGGDEEVAGIRAQSTAVDGGPRRRRSRQPASLNCLELGLVDGLLVGLFAADLALIEQLLDGRVHGAHAELAAGLHGVLELIELALADEIGDRRRVDQDLERRDAALLVGALQQLLRDHAAQRGRQHGAHVRLLVRGEHVHHAIDRRRRAVGVQRAHHQDAHLRRGHRDAHGLEVAQLAHQDDVRILAQGRVQRAERSWRVHADLALADEAVLALVHELDRILDGEDVALLARLMSSIMAASVVDLPEPVLPVTRIRPLLARHICRTASGIFSSSSVSALEGMARNTAPMPFSWRMTLTRKRAALGERVGEVRAVLGLEALDAPSSA